MSASSLVQTSSQVTPTGAGKEEEAKEKLLELIHEVESVINGIAVASATSQGGTHLRSSERKRAALSRRARAHVSTLGALRSLNSGLSLYGHRLQESMQMRLLSALEPLCEIPPSCLRCQQSHLSIYVTPMTVGNVRVERDREQEAEVRMAINCLGNLVSQGHKGLHGFLQPAYRILFEDLSSLSAYIRSNTAINRLLSSTLHSLSCVVKTGAVTISDEEFRKLLRIAKMCCFYATPTLPILALGLQGSSASDSSDSSGSDYGTDGDATGSESDSHSDGRRRVGGASPSTTTGGGTAAKKDSSWRIRMHGAELLGACGAANVTKKRLWSMQLCSFLFPMSPIFSSPPASSSALLYHITNVQQQKQQQIKGAVEQYRSEAAVPCLLEKQSEKAKSVTMEPLSSAHNARAQESSPATPERDVSTVKMMSAKKGSFRVDVSKYTPSYLLIGITSVSLCQLLMEEAVDKVRVSLTNALASMIDGAHLYLSTADDEDPCDAKYLTIGQQIGGTLFQLHMTLLAVLQCSVTGKALRCASVPSDVLTTAVLQCLSRLVKNSPYDRLMVGYLSEVTRFTEPFLRHSDATVQAAALGCLASVFGTLSLPLPEVELFLSKVTAVPQSSVLVDDEESIGCTNIFEEKSRERGVSLELLKRCTTWSECNGCSSTMIETILSFLVKGKGLARSNAYQVMSNVARSYYECFQGYWQSVLDAVVVTMKKTKSENVRCSAMSLLYAGAKSAAELQMSDGVGPTRVMVKDEWKMEKGAWKRIMAEILPLAKGSASHSVQGSFFLLLSTLTPIVLDFMNEKKPDMVATIAEMVLSAVSSPMSKTSVRAQALEALRPLLQYEPLSSSPSFLSRAWAPLLRLLRGKTSANVRGRACSVLATLCETLVHAKKHYCGEGMNRRVRERGEMWEFRLLSSQSLSAIGQTLGRLAEEKSDKTKVSALRGIGHFGYFLPTHFLCDLESPGEYTAILVTPVVVALDSNNAKVLWNACYAMAKLFENPLLYRWPVTATLLQEGMKKLAACMHGSENFKIRINAALSLAVPSRSEFAESFCSSVWPSLLLAWKNASRATDFSGYRYSHTLRNQVASTLLHVMKETEDSDVSPLAEILTEEAEVLFEFISFSELSLAPVTPSSGKYSNSPRIHRRRRSSNCVELSALKVELALLSLHQLYSSLVAKCPAKQEQLGRHWQAPVQ